MEIKTGEYRLHYAADTHTIACAGSLRLNGVEEYKPIVDVLNGVALEQPQAITLDLRGLEFLNSSGINVLAKFVINVRQRAASDLVVLGSKSVPWQGKSLVNLQRLMPKLQLIIE